MPNDHLLPDELAMRERCDRARPDFGDRLTQGQTAWDFACQWYDVDGIERAIRQSGDKGFGSWEKIPENVNSREFAEWLTHQYRLAMHKGIQVGRGTEQQALAAERAEVERLRAELEKRT